MQTKQLTLVWLLLMSLTGVSWVVATLSNTTSNSSLGSYGALASSGLLIIAFIKVRMIIHCFMEVHKAPSWLKLINDIWIVAVLAIIIFIFYGR